MVTGPPMVRASSSAMVRVSSWIRVDVGVTAQAYASKACLTGLTEGRILCSRCHIVGNHEAALIACACGSAGCPEDLQSVDDLF
jgi:uncharacterized paraquat-inducible protein A